MMPTFPATYSTVCPTALSSLIAEKYQLRNVGCKFLVRGVGDTYLVESSDGCFILRIYRSSHRSLPQIKEEVKLLQALQQAGVSVSYPVADILGDTIQTILAIEGERHAVLIAPEGRNTGQLLSASLVVIINNVLAFFLMNSLSNPFNYQL